jgi:hypothetical protein
MPSGSRSMRNKAKKYVPVGDTLEGTANTDLERVVKHQGEQLAILAAKIAQLENPGLKLEWMSINAAVASPHLKGKISAKQVRDRIKQSISDPVTATLVANVHYQIVPGTGGRNRYTVNAIALGQWLSDSTSNN